MSKINPCDICGVIPHVQKSYSRSLIVHRCREFSSGWGSNKAVVEKWNNSNSQEIAEAETQSASPTNNRYKAALENIREIDSRHINNAKKIQHINTVLSGLHLLKSANVS